MRCGGVFRAVLQAQSPQGTITLARISMFNQASILQGNSGGLWSRCSAVATMRRGDGPPLPGADLGIGFRIAPAGAVVALGRHEPVEGPFPSELFDADGDRLGERGHEFGVVTGRKRRCGWFDAALVRQSVKVNGITGIALTKLDVLDGFKEIKICTGYDIDGKIYDHLPANQRLQAKAKPVYETIEGWSETTQGARSWADLPAAAIKYVRRIEELIEAPVALLSTSPERDDTILVHDPFSA